jgi:hypothetical protein
MQAQTKVRNLFYATRLPVLSECDEGGERLIQNMHLNFNCTSNLH